MTVCPGSRPPSLPYLLVCTVGGVEAAECRRRLSGPRPRARGCLIGRLARADLTEGRDRGEFDAALDPAATASTLLARAAADPTAFDQSIEGALALLDRADHR